MTVENAGRVNHLQNLEAKLRQKLLKNFAPGRGHKKQRGGGDGTL